MTETFTAWYLGWAILAWCIGYCGGVGQRTYIQLLEKATS